VPSLLSPRAALLSYHLSYFSRTIHDMGRVKRSISLSGDLAQQIEDAAAESGTSVSAWLAESAAHRLRMDAGRKALAEWESENGPLTDVERREAKERVDRLLGPDDARQSA